MLFAKHMFPMLTRPRGCNKGVGRVRMESEGFVNNVVGSTFGKEGLEDGERVWSGRGVAS